MDGLLWTVAIPLLIVAEMIVFAVTPYDDEFDFSVEAAGIETAGRLYRLSPSARACLCRARAIMISLPGTDGVDFYTRKKVVTRW